MTKITLTVLAAGVFLFVAGCQSEKTSDNPFLKPYDTPFGVPAFDKIKAEHFEPAVKKGMAKHNEEIAAIIKNTEEPNFENTIAALDYSGNLLGNVLSVFYNLTSANTDSTLQALAMQFAGPLSKHSDDINLNPELFARVKAVYEKRNELNLNPDQLRLTEKYYRDFVRGGANLDAQQQEKLRELNQQLSVLGLQFGENLLAENNGFQLVIDNTDDLAGLPESVVAAAAADAKAAGMEGKWLFTLHKPSLIPFITYSDKRDLREKLYSGYFMRGNNGNKNDNKQVISQIVKFRKEKAELLGYTDYADYVLEENMAKEAVNVYDLLNKLWTPALKRAKAERDDMQKMIKKEGGNFNLESWDWWYYAEKVRKDKYNLDEEMLRPYFSLEGVKKGIFNLTEKLYGLKYIQRADIPTYHPDAMAYEVQEADGKHVGVLFLDFHPRASKQGGAWCTTYRNQYIKADGEFVTPVVSIVCNFTKPSGDTPALLSFDETETFFHEFGHALHALFSNTTYPGLMGVPQDFVELPSQIMEHWASHPEYLKQYAVHYKTGEVIPNELVAKLEASSHFNQGFATVEYLAASLLDMDYHTTADVSNINVEAFEKASMDKIGLINEIWPRYRSTYFGHIFSGGEYASGYYVYIWAEVLDSDAFEAFKESGDIFNKEIAAKFRNYVLAPGGTKDGMELYTNFRGKEPIIEPLLRNRGLL